MKPIFHGSIVKGEFLVCVQQERQRQAYLKGLEGSVADEIIQRPSQSKTMAQLAYLHGVCFRLASEASGYTEVEVKGLLKEHFLKRFITSPSGKEVSYTPSLADLKKDETSKLIEDIIIFCAKHWSCIIPPPEDVKL